MKVVHKSQKIHTSHSLAGFEPMDLRNAMEHEPQPPVFVFPGLEAGEVGIFSGPRGMGKTMLALHAAVTLAGGRDLLGFAKLGVMWRPTPQRVVYLAGEDSDAGLGRRINAIGTCLEPCVRNTVAEHLTILPVLGGRLNVRDDRCLGDIIEFCTGASLVVLDPLSRFHNLNEYKRTDMNRLFSVLECVAAKSGAAVMCLCHTAEEYDDNRILLRNVRRRAEIDHGRPSERSSDKDRAGFFVCLHAWGPGCMAFYQWYERNAEGVLMPLGKNRTEVLFPTLHLGHTGSEPESIGKEDCG